MSKTKKVIFFGTPDFSLAPLKTLYLGGYEIIGIYTQEPKKKSRGMNLKKTPVHEWADSQLLPVFFPNKLNDDSLKNFQKLKPDIAILFAYGKIIPQSWLDTPLYGFVNIHASLLPKWRGAAPIQRAIENNDKKIGISIMKMNNRLDEGPIIDTKEILISNNMNGQELIDIISNESCSFLFNTLKHYFKGSLLPFEQDDTKASYANKITKLECEINWNEDSSIIERKIRAFYPYPCVWFNFRGKRYKVLKANKNNQSGKPGTILDNQLKVACGKESIIIEVIQAEGKKSMISKNFLFGNKIFLPGTNLNE